MKTLAEVRKAVKALGWSLKTKSYSFGTMASYSFGEYRLGDVIHASDKKTLSACATLNSFIEANKADLIAIGLEEGIGGLRGIV